MSDRPKRYTSEEKLRRYSFESYPSRRELIRGLGFSTIDQMWSDIQSFRRENATFLHPMRLASLKDLWFCLKDDDNTIRDNNLRKLTLFAEKLHKAQEGFAALPDDSEQKLEIIKNMKLACVRNANILCGSPLSELSLRALVTGQYRESDPRHRNVVNYLGAIESLPSIYPIDDPSDAIGQILQLETGMSELLTFYRESDFGSIYTSATIDRKYDSAPASQIESLMDGLYDFLGQCKESEVVIALAALYFVNYVKPFDSANDLVASLFAKVVLAHHGLDKIAAILPLEAALQPSDKLRDYSNEIQSTGDITYFILNSISILSPMLDELLDKIALAKKSIIAREVHSISIEEARSESPEAAREIEETALPKEDIVPVEVVKKPDATPAIQEIPTLPEEEVIAVTVPKAKLTDKEIKLTARYIMETNPRIKKSQATFYASHCTIGRYYSINDFKRSARCAYETARTSMDLLAEEGFYKKYKIKNKYVYTPIQQERKEN